MSERTRHRVYVASSWRNPIQQDVVAALRADRHDVYDFRNPEPGENGFSWRHVGDREPHGRCSACGETDPAKKGGHCPMGRAAPHEWGDAWDAEYFSKTVLDHPIAARGFELDMKALRACSACVLVLPCGRSAHLELGYAVGKGRLTIVYMPSLDEPELMIRMCDYVETTLDGVRKQLSQNRDCPRWQTDLTPGATEERCQLYRHRECQVCRGCWRHGTCTCGPERVQ